MSMNQKKRALFIMGVIDLIAKLDLSPADTIEGLSNMLLALAQHASERGLSTGDIKIITLDEEITSPPVQPTSFKI